MLPWCRGGGSVGGDGLVPESRFKRRTCQDTGNAALLDALGDEMVGLRKGAAAALGEISDPAARSGLEAVVNNADPDVRKTPRWALDRLPA